VILRRYIISEILKPAAAILTVLVIIFASYCAVAYLAQAVAGSLPPGTVGLLILLRIGMALEVLLPTTFYLSVIIALGRLYKDSEMTAFPPAAGHHRPSKPVFMPPGGGGSRLRFALHPSEAYEEIYRGRTRPSPVRHLAVGSRPFSTFKAASTFFCKRWGPSSRGRNGVHSGARKRQRQVIQAGRMIGRGGPQRPANAIFSRWDALRVSGQRRGGKITRFDQGIPHAERSAQLRYRRKAASTAQLIGRAGRHAELQWRLSTPLSTILLAVIGVPLSKSNPRRGKYAKLGVAIIIFAFYYQMFVIAKTWVEKSLVPPMIGIWWVPLLLAVLAVFLLWRTGEVFYRRPR
jgi:lipopolysaccharide export system permease protein